LVKTGEWIGKGWELVKQDLGMHIVICLIIGLVSGTGLGGLITPALTCGWMYLFLQKMRDPKYKIAIGDVFSKGFEVFVPSLVAGLLIGVFASVGSIACGVGAIVVYGLLILAMPLIIDKRMDFWPAIQTSLETTKANWLGWSLFALALFGLYLLGVIVCVVGVLVTTPIIIAATVVAYKDTFPEQAAAPGATPPVA
jgi:uncharacterized membrane protein